jgi:glucose repression regulatory protein TUP1
MYNRTNDRGAPTERHQQPVLPAPQVPSGSSSIFGSLPNAPQPADHSSAGGPPPQNGNYGQDRLPLIGQPPSRSSEAEHPSKRLRLDTDPSNTPPYLSARPPPDPQQAPPANRPPQNPAQNRPYPSHRQAAPSAAPETPTEIKEAKKEGGPDWMTMYNPKVKRTLDVELVHTLIHDRCVLLERFPLGICRV